MGLNVTNVSITTALESLRYALITRLTDKQAEQLRDELIKLCNTYAPDTFSKIEDNTEGFPPIGFEDLFLCPKCNSYFIGEIEYNNYQCYDCGDVFKLK